MRRCSRYDYEGVESDKAEAVMSHLRDIIADPSKVSSPVEWQAPSCGLQSQGSAVRRAILHIAA